MSAQGFFAGYKNAYAANPLLAPSLVLPFFLAELCWVIPADLFFLSAFIVAILSFHFCIEVSFEGFRRMSRYRLSQKHRALDNLFSIIGVALPLLAIITRNPWSLLLMIAGMLLWAYSLRVSPDNPAKDAAMAWYKCPYMVPIYKVLILIMAAGGLFFKIMMV